MTVFFHGSFGLNRQRMSGLLMAALKTPDLSDKELAVPFGYNAPFTTRYRSWLHKTGLTHRGRPLRLTEFGEAIVREDPGLETIPSMWFMHHELTGNEDRAEAWDYFANDFLPNHDSFSEDELLAGLTDKLRSHSEQHFGPGSRMNRTIVRKLIECYTEEQALGPLGVLNANDDGTYTWGKPKELGPWPNPEQLAAAY